MGHGIDLLQAPAEVALAGGAARPRGAAARALEGLNRWLMRLGGIALVASAVVLCHGVITRALFKSANDWQDEVAVFLLVSTVFLCCGAVQAARGHVAIEALAGALPPRAERARRFLVDVASLAFVAFFAWKSWHLWHEGWVDGQRTSSSFASPLWIPYLAMAVGSSLLALQIGVQLAVTDAVARPGAHGGGH